MSKHSEFLFATDSTRLYFPWMCLLMVFIGSILCGGGIITYNLVHSWHEDIAKSLTIQIDTYDSNGQFRGENIAVDVEKALSIVRTTPGVKGASVLDENQMSELMAPWVGADIPLDTLPLPKLIDVEIDADHPPFLQQLKMDLDTLVPSATMDSQRIWLADLLKLSHRIFQIVMTLLVLLAGTIIFSVAYTTRASLNIHESVIKLVHMMGAKDVYITTKYALYNFKRSFIGSMLGFLCAIPLLILLIYGFKSTITTSFQIEFTLLQWGLMVLWPILICFISAIVTSRTVLIYLKRFL